MLNHINLRYQPKQDDVVAAYTINSTSETVAEVANKLASLSAVSRFHSINANKKYEKAMPTVYKLNGNFAYVAYPIELFEKDNVPQMLAVLSGNSYSINDASIRLDDIGLPKAIVDEFNGPAFGIKGIRSYLKAAERPLLATTLPNNLKNEKEHALAAKHSWLGGCDIVKDSPFLTNHSFNSFKKRLSEVVDAQNKAEDLTNQPKIYVPNITAETNEMIRRAEIVKDHGITHALVNIPFAGISSLQSLSRNNFHVAVEGHVPYKGLYLDGISPIVIAKIARLLGADQVTMPSNINNKSKSHIFEKPWHNIKPSFAVCHINSPAQISKLVDSFGNNIIIDLSDHINSHVHGPLKGSQEAKIAISHL